MKEKIKEKLNNGKIWLEEHKDKIMKLGLAGGVLYMAGYIHATNRIMDHDKVYVSDNQVDDDIEVIDF